MAHKKKKYKSKKAKGYGDRVSIVSGIVFCLLGFLVIRLAWRMLIEGRELEAKANAEWQKEISVTATRGDILDRNVMWLLAGMGVLTTPC